MHIFVCPLGVLHNSKMTFHSIIYFFPITGVISIQSVGFHIFFFMNIIAFVIIYESLGWFIYLFMFLLEKYLVDQGLANLSWHSSPKVEQLKSKGKPTY